MLVLDIGGTDHGRVERGVGEAEMEFVLPDLALGSDRQVKPGQVPDADGFPVPIGGRLSCSPVTDHHQVLLVGR